jgi:hypothetical protein
MTGAIPSIGKIGSEVGGGSRAPLDDPTPILRYSEESDAFHQIYPALRCTSEPAWLASLPIKILLLALIVPTIR